VRRVREIGWSAVSTVDRGSAPIKKQCSDWSMARKKVHSKKQVTTLVPHRTPDLSVLLERAKIAASPQAVKAYLDGGGSTEAFVHDRAGQFLPLLRHVILNNAHPHRELEESVRLLVEAGANINTLSGPDDDERTALMSASQKSCCTKALQALLQNGADVLVSMTAGTTALHTAAAAGCTASCDVLLARESSLVHIKDINGCTAMMHAAAYGYVDTVKVLLMHRADVNTVNPSDTTPLMAACSYKQVDMATFLIKAGADVNAVDCDGRNVLMLAAVKAENIGLIHLLLDSGADMCSTDNKGQNVLCIAAYYGHVLMMELFVQRGLSITTIDSVGETLLMKAARDGHKPAMEWLLQQGAAVNAVSNEGFTALHNASSSSGDDATLIELLLASAADVTRYAVKATTALDAAATVGNVKCAKALIAAGVDVNFADTSGASSLHMALIKQHACAAEVLLNCSEFMADNEYCCDSLTALMMCSTVDTVKLLLAAGADVHVANDVGDTCLHVAARHNYKAPVICLLIKAGANLHAVNNSGKTAAQLAHDKSFKLIEQLLNRAAEQEH
jgi:ankyrin repeat protein